MEIKRVSEYGWSIWIGDGRRSLKSITFMFHPSWFRVTKVNPLFLFRTNGAVRGKDIVYDMNIKIWMLFFSYTDWNYWRSERG